METQSETLAVSKIDYLDSMIHRASALWIRTMPGLPSPWVNFAVDIIQEVVEYANLALGEAEPTPDECVGRIFRGLSRLTVHSGLTAENIVRQVEDRNGCVTYGDDMLERLFNFVHANSISRDRIAHTCRAQEICGALYEAKRKIKPIDEKRCQEFYAYTESIGKAWENAVRFAWSLGKTAEDVYLLTEGK